LGLEEANLRHARRLARQHGWWRRVISTMQGLRQLYAHTGRRGEWARLVEEILPDFVDPASDGPRPGREADWGLVTQYRVRLAREARQWAAAERLQRLLVDWARQQAAAALASPAAEMDGGQRYAIGTLAVSVQELGHILREQGQQDCVPLYEESIVLFEQIELQPQAAVTAFNLGHAYKNLPALRDLAAAERWYGRSLEMRADGDRLGRGKCYNQLGLVATNGSRKRGRGRGRSRPAGPPQRRPELCPAGAGPAARQCRGRPGGDPQPVGRYLPVRRADGARPGALPAVRSLQRTAGNFYGAGQTRYNVALMLYQQGRAADARAYAEAALRNYQVYGPSAAADIEKTQRLLQAINQL
jgi:tetratricopeptide (TPR) repeat protein